VTPCTYFVICGLFSPKLFNISVYTALEDGTVQNLQLGRMWTEDVVGWFDKLYTLHGGTFKYHEENCYDRNVQKYYCLGQLGHQERLVREAGKKELKWLVPLYQTTNRHIPQYDVLCRKKDRNCI
jgi:hypothetical protein